MPISLTSDNYELVRAAWTAMDQTYGAVAVGHSLMPHDNSAGPSRPARQQPFAAPPGYIVKAVINSSPTGKFTIYVNQSEGVVMVVPTGTNGNGDTVGWATNLIDYGRGQWENSKSEVLAAINQELAPPGAEGSMRLVFAGDSRGGALAQFALNDFVLARNTGDERYPYFSAVTNDKLAIITHVSPGVRNVLGEHAVPAEQLSGIASHHSATKVVHPSGSWGLETELVSQLGGAYLDPNWSMHYYTVPTPYPGLTEGLLSDIPYAHRLVQSGWDYFYQNSGAGFGSFQSSGQPRSYFPEVADASLARALSLAGTQALCQTSRLTSARVRWHLAQ